ncbi:MAG TPA: HAD family acid phosphatase [Vicinamibacteria bacterium]|nr:HAD family acid phosphatase [Vicinamibacteria bacterium]
MRRAVSLTLAAGLVACATSSGTPPVATRAHSGGYPAPTIRWARTSAEYRVLALQAYGLARERVLAAAAGRAPRSWAVILDIDETVLDTSLYANERMAAGSGYDEASWAEHVRRRVDSAVPGARGFLEAVRGHGGVIALVSNRREPVCEDTRRNLEAERLPFDVVLCRPEGGPGDKEPRFRQVAEGAALPGLGPLEVLAFVGDNILDFPGGAQTLRDAPEEALAGFGTRFFLLPNPVYGSWERNADR